MDNQPVSPQVPVSHQQPNLPEATPVPPSQTYLGMFERRMGRLAFFLSFIYLFAIPFILITLQLAVPFTSGNSPADTRPDSTLVNVVTLLFGTLSVVLFLPVGVSAYIRRLHDVNQTGWLTLLVLVPFVNTLLFLFLLFASGNRESNKYGPPVNSNSFLVVLGFKKPA